MGSLPIPAEAARLRVLEVAKVICFLQGHLVRVMVRVRVRVRVSARIRARVRVRVRVRVRGRVRGTWCSPAAGNQHMMSSHGPTAGLGGT